MVCLHGHTHFFCLFTHFMLSLTLILWLCSWTTFVSEFGMWYNDWRIGIIISCQFSTYTPDRIVRVTQPSQKHKIIFLYCFYLFSYKKKYTVVSLSSDAKSISNNSKWYLIANVMIYIACNKQNKCSYNSRKEGTALCISRLISERKFLLTVCIWKILCAVISWI